MERLWPVLADEPCATKVSVAAPRVRDTHWAVSMSATLKTWVTAALARRVPWRAPYSAFSWWRSLQDGPELDPVAGHQAVGLGQRLQPPEGRELVEQEEDGRLVVWSAVAGWLSREGVQGLGDEQAQPAGVAGQPFGGQDEEDGGALSAQVLEREVGARQAVGDAAAVEEVGVALGAGEHAGGLAVGLAQVAVGGARHQAVGGGAGLHRLQGRGEARRRRGQEVADGGQRRAAGRRLGDHVQDHAGDQRLGLLVPVRLADLFRRVVDQGLGDQPGVLGEVLAERVQRRQRIVGRGGASGDPERVDDMDRPEALAGAGGDAGVLALGVDTQDGAVGVEQVRQDDADALARARRREGQEVARAVVAHQPSAACAADDQASRSAERAPRPALVREPGAPVGGRGSCGAVARRPAQEPQDPAGGRRRQGDDPLGEQRRQAEAVAHEEEGEAGAHIASKGADQRRPD